jgi:hypothetical protein
MCTATTWSDIHIPEVKAYLNGVDAYSVILLGASTLFVKIKSNSEQNTYSSFLTGNNSIPSACLFL